MNIFRNNRKAPLPKRLSISIEMTRAGIGIFFHRSIRSTKKHGFTLIEALVASAISLVAIGIIYAIYSSGNDIFEIKRYQADMEGAGRLAMEAITKELRGATRTSSQIPSPNLLIPAAPATIKSPFIYRKT